MLLFLHHDDGIAQQTFRGLDFKIFDKILKRGENGLHPHNERRYFYLFVFFVCLSVADDRPNGWADQDETWHRDSC